MLVLDIGAINILTDIDYIMLLPVVLWLTLLVEHQEEHLACKKLSDEMLS